MISKEGSTNCKFHFARVVVLECGHIDDIVKMLNFFKVFLLFQEIGRTNWINRATNLIPPPQKKICDSGERRGVNGKRELRNFYPYLKEKLNKQIL